MKITIGPQMTIICDRNMKTIFFCHLQFSFLWDWLNSLFNKSLKWVSINKYSVIVVSSQMNWNILKMLCAWTLREQNWNKLTTKNILSYYFETLFKHFSIFRNKLNEHSLSSYTEQIKDFLNFFFLFLIFMKDMRLHK